MTKLKLNFKIFMDQISFFEPLLIYCDEFKAEDFKTSDVVIFQGNRISNTFSLNVISDFLDNEKYPWLFIAKEKLQNNFYIAIGFKEDGDFPLYVTNILCTFIRNKVFILNIFKCSKKSKKLLKMCHKHEHKIQIQLAAQEQLKNDATQNSDIIVEKYEQESNVLANADDSTENLEFKGSEIQIQNTSAEGCLSNEKEIDVFSSLFLPSEPGSPLPSIEPAKPLITKWTENLPQFKWETPLKQCNIAQTEIEANLGLFNEGFLEEDTSPLQIFKNIAQEKLMFAPCSSDKFIDRIISHESIFDFAETSDE